MLASGGMSAAGAVFISYFFRVCSVLDFVLACCFLGIIIMYCQGRLTCLFYFLLASVGVLVGDVVLVHLFPVAVLGVIIALYFCVFCAGLLAADVMWLFVAL